MIELIVVVAVVAILASIALPLASVFEDRARTRATREEMESLEESLLAYYEDSGAFPSSLDSLATQGYLPGSLGSEEYASDGWFRDYEYSVSGMTASLVSYGPDATASTEDDILRTVAAEAIARDKTRDEMETIHVALRNYESVRLANDWASLPSRWASKGKKGGKKGAFEMLVDRGLLPNDTGFLVDAWGSTYVYGGTPEDHVTSVHLGAGS